MENCITNSFLGMKITANYSDINDPHLDIDYKRDHCEFSLRDMSPIKGCLPDRALGFVVEWVEQNISDIEDNHLRVMYGRPLKQIRPLV